MAISKEQVAHAADLARLDLSEETLAKMATQLGQVLDYIGKLNELDTSGVEPLSHPGGLSNVMRDDLPSPSLPTNEALRNAPEQQDGFFRVPRVIE